MLWHAKRGCEQKKTLNSHKSEGSGCTHLRLGYAMLVWLKITGIGVNDTIETKGTDWFLKYGV